MFVYQYLIWGTALSVVIAQSQSSTTSPLHYEVSTDVKVVTQNPVLLDLFPLDVFNKTLGFPSNLTTALSLGVSRSRKNRTRHRVYPKTKFSPPYEFSKSFTFPPVPQFDFASIKPVSFENIGDNSTHKNNFYRTYPQGENEKPIKDGIIQFHNDLSPLEIQKWANLGVTNLKIPNHSINFEEPVFHVGKYGKLGGGAAALGVLLASGAACCRKKSRNLRDTRPEEEEEEGCQNDTLILIPDSDETDRGLHSNNGNIIDV